MANGAIHEAVASAFRARVCGRRSRTSFSYPRLAGIHRYLDRAMPTHAGVRSPFPKPETRKAR
ncbi:hypothetical protein X946_5231 [Burkholderia sp. ABCPW 111]|nr:hypothetical protein X946_5231 [Burkholderia sp. ABCPW 111]